MTSLPRVCVIGAGSSGIALCKELHEAGARLTIADVDEQKLARVREELGAQVAKVTEIHRSECDVYAPCALGGELNDATVPELRCSVVAGAANNQLAESRHGDALQERGILYAPDYAINAGGLINVAQEVAGYDADRARTRTLAVYDTIREIAERAKASGRSTHRIADEMVAEKLAAAG